MKTSILLIIVLLTLFSTNLSQNLQFAGEFPSQGVKIYSIKFVDSQNGWAESYLGNNLRTEDGGKTWNVSEGHNESTNSVNFATVDLEGWSTDIICSIMSSTDGGKSWFEYPKKQEEHFCQVYFKDENTGWKVAEEFLSSVIDTINSVMDKGEHELKIGTVYKCREYYTKKDEGWTLGWCFKNLVIE